jgi:hypothetical protein
MLVFNFTKRFLASKTQITEEVKIKNKGVFISITVLN